MSTDFDQRSRMSMENHQHLSGRAWVYTAIQSLQGHPDYKDIQTKNRAHGAFEKQNPQLEHPNSNNPQKNSRLPNSKEFQKMRTASRTLNIAFAKPPEVVFTGGGSNKRLPEISWFTSPVVPRALFVFQKV